MPSAGFEPAIPAIKQFQTYALDCTVIYLFVLKDLLQRKYVQHGLQHKRWHCRYW